jgi:hypothetical protein
MNKTFGELSQGSRFILNGTEYVKVQEVKVSCCRTVNAELVSDSNNRTYIQPSTVVVVNA